MRIRTLLSVVSLVFAQAAHAQVNIESVLVGFTSTTLPLTAGYFAFTGACQAEFPNTRICTTEELLGTRRVPASLTGSAFVRGDSGGSPCAGVPGLELWSASGLWLNVTDCLASRAIACCGLPVDPAQGDLDQDGATTLRDESILRRMLAGLPILLTSSP